MHTTNTANPKSLSILIICPLRLRPPPGKPAGGGRMKLDFITACARLAPRSFHPPGPGPGSPGPERSHALLLTPPSTRRKSPGFLRGHLPTPGESARRCPPRSWGIGFCCPTAASPCWGRRTAAPSAHTRRRPARFPETSPVKPAVVSADPRLHCYRVALSSVQRTVTSMPPAMMLEMLPLDDAQSPSICQRSQCISSGGSAEVGHQSMASASKYSTMPPAEYRPLATPLYVAVPLRAAVTLNTVLVAVSECAYLGVHPPLLASGISSFRVTVGASNPETPGQIVGIGRRSSGPLVEGIRNV